MRSNPNFMSGVLSIKHILNKFATLIESGQAKQGYFFHEICLTSNFVVILTPETFICSVKSSKMWQN